MKIKTHMYVCVEMEGRMQFSSQQTFLLSFLSVSRRPRWALFAKRMNAPCSLKQKKSDSSAPLAVDELLAG